MLTKICVSGIAMIISEGNNLFLSNLKDLFLLFNARKTREDGNLPSSENQAY